GDWSSDVSSSELFLDLKPRRCLLVGCGEVATRKGRMLAKTGAVLRIVAPQVSEELRELVQQCHGELLQREYQSTDLEGCVLAIAATDRDTHNRTVSEDARARNIPVKIGRAHV